MQLQGCFALPKASSQGCLAMVALQQKNLSICGLVDPIYASKLDCFSSVADALGGPDACAQLLSLDDQGMCYASMALKRNDSSICNSTSIVGLKLACIALAERDARVCSQISNAEYSDFCISQLALIQGDVGICTAASGDSRNSCIISMAVAQKDASVCNNNAFAGSGSGEARAECYEKVALATGNGAICESISNLSQKDGCYCKMALATNASGWYELINSTSVRAACK